MSNYHAIATEVRRQVLKMIHTAQTSHIGSNFSCIDILTVLHEITDFKTDKLIYSKGWVAAAAYVFLARRGVISWEDLETYCQPGSKYIGLVERSVPGIEFAGGSMGHGLPAAVGMALGKKRAGEPGRVFVLMSDGEMDCGTTWESALLAAHHKLDNLTVIVDDNKFQAMGRTNEVLQIEPLAKKWQAFGWRVSEIDGHDYEHIAYVLSTDDQRDTPTIIISHTIKGKGVSFMENNLTYHYKHITDEEYQQACAELS